MIRTYTLPRVCSRVIAYLSLKLYRPPVLYILDYFLIILLELFYKITLKLFDIGFPKSRTKPDNNFVTVFFLKLLDESQTHFLRRHAAYSILDLVKINDSYLSL